MSEVEFEEPNSSLSRNMNSPQFLDAKPSFLEKLIKPLEKKLGVTGQNIMITIALLCVALSIVVYLFFIVDVGGSESLIDNKVKHPKETIKEKNERLQTQAQ